MWILIVHLVPSATVKLLHCWIYSRHNLHFLLWHRKSPFSNTSDLDVRNSAVVSWRRRLGGCLRASIGTWFEKIPLSRSSLTFDRSSLLVERILLLSRLLLYVVTRGKAFFFLLGSGAGPWSLALWNPLLMRYAGYPHASKDARNSANRISTKRLEQNTTIFFARVYGMLFLTCSGWWLL